jgi:hypothetical protein
LPDSNHDLVAQFVAFRFAGAIKAWLSNNRMTKNDLIAAAGLRAGVVELIDNRTLRGLENCITSRPMRRFQRLNRRQMLLAVRTTLVRRSW